MEQPGSLFCLSSYHGQLFLILVQTLILGHGVTTAVIPDSYNPEQLLLLQSYCQQQDKCLIKCHLCSIKNLEVMALFVPSHIENPDMFHLVTSLHLPVRALTVTLLADGPSLQLKPLTLSAAVYFLKRCPLGSLGFSVYRGVMREMLSELAVHVAVEQVTNPYWSTKYRESLQQHNKRTTEAWTFSAETKLDRSPSKYTIYYFYM